MKHFIALCLVALTCVFTGCGKQKEVKAVAIEEQAYTQESKPAAKAEKKEAVKEAPVKQEAEKAKPAKKAKKADKAAKK